MGIAQDGSAVNPTAMMDAIQGNTQLMDNLAQSQPELMEAIRTRNVDAFQKALRASAESKRKAEAERQQEMQVCPGQQNSGGRGSVLARAQATGEGTVVEEH